MTSALVEPRPWSRRRWWGMVGLVFGVQLALIFWLGETSLAHRRPAAPGLTLKLAGSASAELLALHDPTLFALPHKQEMPTPTWWRTPQPELHEFAWPEPTNHPHLAIDQLGTAFNRLAETNAFGPLPLPAKPLPELTLPELPPLAISAPRSTLRLEWDQAPRRLLTSLEFAREPGNPKQQRGSDRRRGRGQAGIGRVAFGQRFQGGGPAGPRASQRRAVRAAES